MKISEYIDRIKKKGASEDKLKTELISGNAVFTKDDEGVIIITDILNNGRVAAGEVVYDGKNALILNRNNEKYYVFKNIPPYIRDVLSKTKEVTVVESENKQNIYSYSVKIRIVDNLGIADEWEEYASQVMENMEKSLKPQELADFMQEAQKAYEELSK